MSRRQTHNAEYYTHAAVTKSMQSATFPGLTLTYKSISANHSNAFLSLCVQGKCFYLNFDIEIKHMDTARDLPFTVKVAQSYLTVCRFDSNAL